MNKVFNNLINKLSFINAIGYEMECLVPWYKYEKLQKEFEIHIDNSIDIEDDYERAEIRFMYFTTDIKYLFKDMIEIWDKYRIKQNNSCGNHMHISFSDKTMYYKFLFPETQKLFVSSYVSYFRKEKYLERLNNIYSKFEFNEKKIYEKIKKQLERVYKTKSRYWAINWNSYSKFKTIEFRIFPYADNVFELLEQVKFLLRFLEEIHRKKITIENNKDIIIV